MLTRDGHCTEGIEALRVGRVCVVLADRFPAVPFGGSNSFIHSFVSTTVHHTLNAVARVKSVIMLQHDHRSRSLCNRIYYGARTHVPLDAQRLLRFASDLDG